MTMDEATRKVWREGFQAGWECSGEGFNGEYPDEGVPWPDSAGYERMLRLERVAKP